MGQVKKTLFKMADQGLDEKVERMMDAIVREMPLRSLVTLSGGKVNFKTMAVVIHLMNRRFGAALRAAIASDSA